MGALGCWAGGGGGGGGGYSSTSISASNICVCFSGALLIPEGTINAAEITGDLMFSWYFSISLPRWKCQENTRSRGIWAPEIAPLGIFKKPIKYINTNMEISRFLPKLPAQPSLD